MLLAHVFESKGKLRRGPESLRPLQVLAIFAVKLLPVKDREEYAKRAKLALCFSH
jgi:hypothetical protein